MPVNVLDAVILTPVVTQALSAAFLIFNTLLDVSTHNWWANVVDGSVEPLLTVAIANKALFKSALKSAPDWFAML